MPESRAEIGSLPMQIEGEDCRKQFAGAENALKSAGRMGLRLEKNEDCRNDRTRA